MRDRLSEAHFPFFARLTASGRDTLAAFVATHVAPGNQLMQRGDRAGGAYLVIGGSLRVYYITAEGREATLYHVEPGSACILALASAFNEEPYPAWVEAGPGGGAFVRIPRDAFRRVLDAEPALRDYVFGVLSGRIFELMRTLEEAGSALIEQRVARYLIRRAGSDGVVRATQVGIASELGTAREVVFRSLRALSTRGLVETGRARVTVLDLPRLRSLAGEIDPA